MQCACRCAAHAVRDRAGRHAYCNVHCNALPAHRMCTARTPHVRCPRTACAPHAHTAPALPAPARDDVAAVRGAADCAQRLLAQRRHRARLRPPAGGNIVEAHLVRVGVQVGVGVGVARLEACLAWERPAAATSAALEAAGSSDQGSDWAPGG
eukprot:scaffold23656_cov43-Phaeocystis_antarctica.AAC.2